MIYMAAKFIPKNDSENVNNLNELRMSLQPPEKSHLAEKVGERIARHIRATVSYNT